MANIASTARELSRPVALERPARARIKPRSMSRILVYSALIGLAMVFSLPFVWLVLTSLKPPAEVFSPEWLPHPVTFENYQDVFRFAPVERWLRNSFMVATLGVVTVVYSSALVAYGFSR